jgi:uncharacterized protein YeaO (DUF488 family)
MAGCLNMSASTSAGHTLKPEALNQTSFSVGCYCENENHCHRSVLRELLVQRGADIAG